MFNAQKFFRIINSRSLCTLSETYKLERLETRTLVRIQGNEADQFLQGLITNDMRHLEQGGTSSMYALLLNLKGRVLYDTIIYKEQEPNTFLLECDLSAVDNFIKHIKIFRVKRKIDVKHIGNELNLYTLFKLDEVDKNIDRVVRNLNGMIVPCNALDKTKFEGLITINDLKLYKDPRVVALGYRVISPVKCDVTAEIKKNFNLQVEESEKNKNYRWFRYSLGVGEGVEDLPPGNCFPLESNCDYLHGISFHKGCYIGQELTARTHHTGVVRKRLLPLHFKNRVDAFPADVTISHEKGNLGKLRGVEGNVGLALLRVTESIKLSEIRIGEHLATTGKPMWWPLEASKEKMESH